MFMEFSLQVLTVTGDMFVNDNNWHDIRIVRSSENEHTLTVDQQSVVQRGSTRRTNLDLSGIIPSYIINLDTKDLQYL